MSYILAKEEIETNITFDYIDKTAFVFTNYAPMRKRLEKFTAKHADEVRIVKNVESGLQIVLPLKWIKIAAPVKRDVSEEEKQKLSQRLKAARASKKEE